MSSMNWEVIATFSEVVSAIAVVASVIYLATQIKRQTTESKLAATRELSAKRVDTMKSILGDEAVAEIYLRAIRDYESLQGVDRMRASMLFHIWTRNSEQEFIHMGTGHADDPYLESVDNVMSNGMVVARGFRQWWQTTGQGFNEDFRHHVNELIAATEESLGSSNFDLPNSNESAEK